MLSIADSLRQSLTDRRISEGLSWAAKAASSIQENADLDSSSSIETLALQSIWIDFDFRLRPKIEQLRDLWPVKERAGLLHRDALLLRFVDATLDMHNERFALAAQRFRTVTGESELLSGHLLLIAYFYLGRCLHYQNRFEDAIQCCGEARVIGEGLPDAALQVAGVDVLRSRILLKYKPLDEALPAVTTLLSASRAAFQGTDDYVTKANILVFLAQVARRGPHQGQSALELLSEAISLFSNPPARSPHPVLARARLHRSRVLREQALFLEQQIESQPVSLALEPNVCSSLLNLEPQIRHVLQQAGAPELLSKFKMLIGEAQTCLDKVTPKKACTASAKDVWQLQSLALDDARCAAGAYEHLGHFRGLGNSWVSEGNVLLDRGEYQEALDVARRAIQLGRQSSETILTRAALLAAESAAQMVEDGLDSNENCVHIARDYSKLALEHAPKTELRIVGRAHVWEARTLLLINPMPTDEERRQIEFHRDEARKISREFRGGSLQRDLERLQARLNPGNRAAEILKRWLETRQGASFAQLQACLTKLAWEVTGTIPALMNLLELNTYKHAQGLLNRAGFPKCKTVKRPKPTSVRTSSSVKLQQR